MSGNKKTIGVIDSGLGGISVLRHLIRELPSEDFVYFGDTANAPYGDKKSSEVRDITVSNMKKLIKDYSAKAVVIACNTATGAAAEKCREIFSDIPIIGIEPAVKPAVMHSEKEIPRVLIMATPLTLSQEKFAHLAEKYNPNAILIPLPCHGLADIIEAGASDNEINILLDELFADIDDHDSIDSIVLGCTHYPLVEGNISTFFPKAKIYDGGLGTALQAKRRLCDDGLLTDDQNHGKLTIISSDDNPDFVKRAEKYLIK